MNITEIEAGILKAVEFDTGSGLLEKANALIGNPVILVDCALHSLLHPTDRLPPDYPRYLEAVREIPITQSTGERPISDGSGRRWFTGPINIRNTLIGYAAICDAWQPFAPETPDLLQCVRKAAALQCSIIGQMPQTSDISPHAHRMLFDDLLDQQVPHAGELDSRLQEIGWNPCGQLYILSIWLENLPPSAQTPMLHSTIVRQIDAVVPVYTYTYHFDRLILLLNVDTDSGLGIHSQEVRRLDALLGNLHLKAGMSQPLSALAEARDAFSQSVTAVELAQKLHAFPDNLIPYDRMAVYHMIQISRSKVDDYHIFLHRAIRILQDHDSRSRQQLLRTLYHYIETSENPGETAKRLGIHKNTLFYRLRKIIALTEIDLDRGDELLHLHLSFRILAYEGAALE